MGSSTFFGSEKTFRAVSLSKTSTPLGVRAVFILSLLVTLCSLARIAPKSSQNSGPGDFSPRENGHEATIDIGC